MAVIGWWAEIHHTLTIPAARVGVRARTPTAAVGRVAQVPQPARMVIATHTPATAVAIPGFPSEILYPSASMYPEENVT